MLVRFYLCITFLDVTAVKGWNSWRDTLQFVTAALGRYQDDIPFQRIGLAALHHLATSKPGMLYFCSFCSQQCAQICTVCCTDLSEQQRISFTNSVFDCMKLPVWDAQLQELACQTLLPLDSDSGTTMEGFSSFVGVHNCLFQIHFHLHCANGVYRM